MIVVEKNVERNKIWSWGDLIDRFKDGVSGQAPFWSSWLLIEFPSDTPSHQKLKNMQQSHLKKIWAWSSGIWQVHGTITN